ncbi:MAG: hypothetical protein OEZ10_13865 [Gammaproteobacteria bacterium]|nr:hypothetical protein [Gammaproteobacteria bacterium]
MRNLLTCSPKFPTAFIAAVLSLPWHPDASADIRQLQNRYQELKPKLAANAYGVPMLLESDTAKGGLIGNVYGIIRHPFESVRTALTTPANWCRIVPQHFNIKACTYQPIDNTCQLNFYAGRKFYENPEHVFRLSYTWQPASYQADYFHLVLSAGQGPLDTRDYRIVAEAIPLNDESTFIRFSYSWKYGAWSRLAMNTYLATLAGNKTGLTVVSTGEQGQPIYINGMAAVAERNALRYYLAIQAFLDTRDVQQDQRFLSRLNSWFDMTAQYRQLFEMDRHDYLSIKTREEQDQQRLQLQLPIQTDNACNKSIDDQQLTLLNQDAGQH